MLIVLCSQSIVVVVAAAAAADVDTPALTDYAPVLVQVLELEDILAYLQVIIEEDWLPLK